MLFNGQKHSTLNIHAPEFIPGQMDHFYFQSGCNAFESDPHYVSNMEYFRPAASEYWPMNKYYPSSDNACFPPMGACIPPANTHTGPMSFLPQQPGPVDQGGMASTYAQPTNFGLAQHWSVDQGGMSVGMNIYSYGQDPILQGPHMAYQDTAEFSHGGHGRNRNKKRGWHGRKQKRNHGQPNQIEGEQQSEEGGGGRRKGGHSRP